MSHRLKYCTSFKVFLVTERYERILASPFVRTEPVKLLLVGHVNRLTYSYKSEDDVN